MNSSCKVKFINEYSIFLFLDSLLRIIQVKSDCWLEKDLFALYSHIWFVKILISMTHLN